MVFLKMEIILFFAGTATAGIAPAYALAEYFNCGFVYVQTNRNNGLASVIEGSLPTNARCHSRR